MRGEPDNRPAAGLSRDDLEVLYRRHERALYNVVYRRIWHPADAQELVQEAFLRLWGMRERVDPARVRPLLFRIALNLASKRRRWQALRRWAGMEALAGIAAPGGDGEASATSDERQRSIRRAIDGLPEHERRVILLLELGELSYGEVAETLGIAPGTVGSRRNKALSRLRAALHEMGYEYVDDTS